MALHLNAIVFLRKTEILSLFIPSLFIHVQYRRIHTDVIVYIFAHLHTALHAEGNMLDKN